jgi:hypothetical protein
MLLRSQRRLCGGAMPSVPARINYYYQISNSQADSLLWSDETFGFSKEP